MLQTQFSRLKNIATQSSYRYNTIYLNQQHRMRFRNRYAKHNIQRLHQIENQFDLVDFQKKGYLYRGEIEKYLENKYQWVNHKVLNELFNTIDWKKMNASDSMYATRYPFNVYSKDTSSAPSTSNDKNNSSTNSTNSSHNKYGSTHYLPSINKPLIWYNLWLLNKRPSYYVSAQIQKLEFYNNFNEDFVNVDVRYEDHEEKLEFDITENSYDMTKPSYQLILPAQENEFFLSYTFTNTRDHNLVYGNAYVSINLRGDKILRQQELSLEVRKNSVVVGRCRVLIYLQTHPQVIRQKLRQKSAKINQNLKQIKDVNMTLPQLKQKQFQYIQFLWGVKHLPSQQIQSQDVPLIIALRTLLIVLLGGLSIVVHVLGRCEPLGLICVFLMLKWRTYVILKVELFLMAWIIIAAMLLDGIWLVFSSHHVSQINYLRLSSAMTLTYFLLGVKFLFFVYLLAFQKPFEKSEQPNFSMEKNEQIN